MCPIRYRTRHFFNNFTTNEDIAMTTDTFLFICHTTNVLLFKFRCNIFMGVRIIKEMPGSVASGTHSISLLIVILLCSWLYVYIYIYIYIYIYTYTTALCYWPNTSGMTRLKIANIVFIIILPFPCSKQIHNIYSNNCTRINDKLL